MLFEIIDQTLIPGFGKIPSEKDRLNKTARGSDMVLDTALSIRLLIPSSPFAL